jgi:chromosome segregation ATPase
MLNNETSGEVEKRVDQPKGPAVLIGILGAGLVMALAGDGYLMVRSNHLEDNLAQMQESTQSQMSKLSDATTSLLNQRLEAINADLRTAQDTADAAVKKTRMEAQKQTKDLSQRLQEQQQEVSGQLTDLKDATTTANNKLNEVSTDVNGVKSDVTGVKTDVVSVKADVATTQSELEKHAAELKRTIGDMGVMSGLIATNGKELNSLRELGERNYYEFDLSKHDGSKKIGDVTLTLKKSDSKRNRYTVDILADDKRVEKRDRTVNEPVQLYVSGNRQPYEIVVNEIDKDKIVGYLATPKVKMARR